MATRTAKTKYLRALGARLKEIRTRKNLSLRDLGHMVEKDAQSISRVEMGDVNPSIFYLFELCQALEVELSEVLKDLKV